MHSARCILGSNEQSNGQLRVCKTLSQQFARYYIRIIQEALGQGQGGYKATPIDWDQMKY